MGTPGRFLSLSGETLIPVSFLSVVFGAAYWLNGLSSRIEAAEMRAEFSETIQSDFETFAKKHLETQTRDLSEIKAQVAGIDARLDVFMRPMKKRD